MGNCESDQPMTAYAESGGLGFFALLDAACVAKGSFLCVGLDPRAATPQDAEEKCKALIKQTAAHACCFKPNAAFFEAHGAAGWAALKRVIEACHAAEVLVLLDCKRGDVGSTAEAYAAACYDDLGADCVTLSPYLGWDAIAPFVTGKYAGKGAFVLCATSNPSAADVQSAAVKDEVARLCGGLWAGKTPETSKPLGLVVGATKLDAVVAARTANREAWLLAPGVGAQGATASDVVRAACAGAPSHCARLIVPVSRAIANADKPGAKAEALKDEINEALRLAAEPKELDEKALLRKLTLAARNAPAPLAPHQTAFVETVLASGALTFGSFTLKSGRQSPYFFNAGLVCRGDHVRALFEAYAAAVVRSELEFDVIFGPAYKGIPLCAGVAAALAGRGVTVDFAYNRKEAKDHGEGGTLVGAPVKGRRVLLVDDVISAGTAVREATGLLKASGAELIGVCVAVDRQEVTGGAEPPAEGVERVSAVDAVKKDLGVPVVNIIDLTGLLRYLEAAGGEADHTDAVRKYRETYGAC